MCDVPRVIISSPIEGMSFDPDLIVRVSIASNVLELDSKKNGGKASIYAIRAFQATVWQLGAEHQIRLTGGFVD